MAQAALNDRMTLPADTWTEVSEVNCTFVAIGKEVEIIGFATPPAVTVRGIPYGPGTGARADDDTLALFVGASGTNKIYAVSRGIGTSLFVSRAAT